MAAALSNLSSLDLSVLADEYAIEGRNEMNREQLIVALRPLTGEVILGYENDPKITPPEPVEPTPAEPTSTEGNFADPNNNPSDLSTRVTGADVAAIQAATEAAGSRPSA